MPGSRSPSVTVSESQTQSGCSASQSVGQYPTEPVSKAGPAICPSGYRKPRAAWASPPLRCLSQRSPPHRSARPTVPSSHRPPLSRNPALSEAYLSGSAPSESELQGPTPHRALPNHKPLPLRDHAPRAGFPHEHATLGRRRMTQSNRDARRSDGILQHGRGGPMGELVPLPAGERTCGAGRAGQGALGPRPPGPPSP